MSNYNEANEPSVPCQVTGNINSGLDPYAPSTAVICIQTAIRLSCEHKMVGRITNMVAHVGSSLLFYSRHLSVLFMRSESSLNPIPF
jgi:hypothetical protein